MKSLSEWLSFIESFHPCEIDLGLDRVSEVAQRLDLVNPDCKVITIGGTNGKGSCVATIEALALRNGLNVGCYTSPHLLEFNERIRLNGHNIDNDALTEAFNTINVTRKETPLTFFEFTTLAALLIFKQNQLDLIILEVGLGGRLDAVNIIEPAAAVVTSVSLDHQSWLGDSIEEIAIEKAGILRQDISNYVGDEDAYEIMVGKSSARKLDNLVGHVELISISEKKDAELLNVCADFSINPRRLIPINLKLAVKSFYSVFSSNHGGINLNKEKENRSFWQSLIPSISLKGRFEVLNKRPLVVADVGHNEDAGKNLSYQIERTPCKGKRYAICGMMADKAIKSFIYTLKDSVDDWLMASLPNERAATGNELQVIAKRLNVKSEAFSSVIDSYTAVSDYLTANDQLYILGSFHTYEAFFRSEIRLPQY